VTVVTHDCDARHIEASRASRPEQPERNNVFEEDSSDHNKGNNPSSSRFFSTKANTMLRCSAIFLGIALMVALGMCAARQKSKSQTTQ